MPRTLLPTPEIFRLERPRVNAAAYVRVSSRSQDNATQREAISRAATARGDEIPGVHWYEEKRSARTLERPELAKIRECVRRGEVTRLYVFRLDRLTRSGIRDTLTLLDELRAGGCEVVTVADGFSLEGPARDVVVAVMAWAAEMERLALGERIAAARARVEAKGGTWGRPRAATAAQVRKVHELRSQLTLRGKPMPIRDIAQRVKLPRSTVAVILSGKGVYRHVVKSP